MGLEENIKCVWKKIGEDTNSTTFESVRKDDINHPLHPCRYTCNGYDTNCSGYKVLPLKYKNHTKVYK